MVQYIRFPFATTGDRVAIPQTTQLDGSVSWEQGYGPDYSRDPTSDPLAKNIPRDKDNDFKFVVSSAVQQYQQFGFPDFITAADNGGVAFEYSELAIVRYDDGSGFKLYQSLTDGNDQLPTNPSYWTITNLSGFDIDSLTAETDPAVADYLPFFDDSAGENRKITFADFLKVVNGLSEDLTPSVSADFVLTYDTSAAEAKKVKIGNIANSALSVTNLRALSAPSAKTQTWACDEIVVKSALAGVTYLGGAQSFAFNGAATGANGMDTGSMPTTGNIYIYAIYNPTTATWACLGTIAGSGAEIYPGANMPSGYTASQLIYAGKTDGSGNFVNFRQIGRTVSISPVQAFSQSSGTAGVYVSVSIATIVPPNCKFISGIAGVPANANTQFTLSPENNRVNELLFLFNNVTTIGYQGFNVNTLTFALLPLVTAQTFYYQMVAGGTQGKVDISSYVF